MKWQFEEKDTDELEVLIQKKSLDHEVQALIGHLGIFEQERPKVLPIKTAEEILLLTIAELIAIEVEGTQLILKTSKASYQTTERLYKFKERLNNPDFVQVSKQSLININHLEKLEASFSGNMLAVLTNKIKVQVSRRYLKALEKQIGL